MPFRSAIVKLTAVCNIDCSYCYMFNQADRTYTRVPPKMPIDLALRLLDRICAYHPRHAADAFSIVLHGGEPLLWNEEHLLTWLDAVDEHRRAGWNLDVAIQTNLVRPLSPRVADALQRMGIRLGISLDGPRTLNDAARVDHLGRGTYDRVMENVARLIADGHEALLGGFLSVANTAIAPHAYLDWVASLPVRRVDVLWPIEYHWRNPPWGILPRADYERTPRIGRWYGKLFTAWWERDDPGIHIRLFSNLVDLALGARSHVDALVNDTYDMFVVNTDGSYEYPDYLRAAGDGSCRTAFDVTQHGIEALHADPGFARLLALRDELPQACNGCRHRAVCGGGFLPGRADPERFLSSQPSVLCADQMHFFDTALRTIRDAISHRGDHASLDTAGCLPA
ncbi:radical SAM protein [Oxalobacteraceae bacterium OM1]|nr:radical SAM protein [Oxalobacteraceae bacterium OM1]